MRESLQILDAEAARFAPWASKQAQRLRAAGMQQGVWAYRVGGCDVQVHLWPEHTMLRLSGGPAYAVMPSNDEHLKGTVEASYYGLNFVTYALAKPRAKKLAVSEYPVHGKPTQAVDWQSRSGKTVTFDIGNSQFRHWDEDKELQHYGGGPIVTIGGKFYYTADYVQGAALYQGQLLYAAYTFGRKNAPDSPIGARDDYAMGVKLWRMDLDSQAETLLWQYSIAAPEDAYWNFRGPVGFGGGGDQFVIGLQPEFASDDPLAARYNADAIIQRVLRGRINNDGTGPVVTYTIEDVACTALVQQRDYSIYEKDPDSHVLIHEKYHEQWIRTKVFAVDLGLDDELKVFERVWHRELDYENHTSAPYVSSSKWVLTEDYRINGQPVLSWQSRHDDLYQDAGMVHYYQELYTFSPRALDARFGMVAGVMCRANNDDNKDGTPIMGMDLVLQVGTIRHSKPVFANVITYTPLLLLGHEFGNAYTHFALKPVAARGKHRYLACLSALNRPLPGTDDAWAVQWLQTNIPGLDLTPLMVARNSPDDKPGEPIEVDVSQFELGGTPGFRFDPVHVF